MSAPSSTCRETLLSVGREPDAESLVFASVIEVWCASFQAARQLHWGQLGSSQFREAPGGCVRARQLPMYAARQWDAKWTGEARPAGLPGLCHGKESRHAR